MTKLVLATVSAETMEAAAKATAWAVSACEGAKVALLQSVHNAVKAIGQPISAAQYDRQFRPFLKAALDKEVGRKGSKLKQSSADQYVSRIKTCVLAILAKAAEPVAGETFWEFYDRAAEPLASAKLPNGEPVWEAKAGRPAKAAGTKSAKGAKAAPAEGSAASASEGGMQIAPELAAALILTKEARDNHPRADKLVKAITSFPEAFDKWAATILADSEKRKAAPKAA